MKKILLLTGDFAEDYETMVPFQMLEMIGCMVHAVCPDKKKGDIIKTAIHDFEGDQTYTEKPGHNFTLNYTFDDIDLNEYDGLFLVGGRAPEYLRLNIRVIELIQFFFKRDLPVAAVCHGIQLLTAAQVIEGKTLTAYPTVAPEIALAKGNYKEVEVSATIVDGNLATSPAWPGHASLIRAFMVLLGYKVCEHNEGSCACNS